MNSVYSVLINKGKHNLGHLLQGPITVEESIDDIALRITFTVHITSDFPTIQNAMDCVIKGVPFGGTSKVTMFSGVIWQLESSRNGAGKLDITVFERTKYLKESEEQYQFKAGTASTRLKIYARDWEIPLGNIPDTKTMLAPALYRPQSIFTSIRKDLIETAQKGGDLYKPRIMSSKLELYKIGSNKKVWQLKGTHYDVGQSRTMDGMVTQVKILGTKEKVKKAKKRKKTSKKGQESGGKLRATTTTEVQTLDPIKAVIKGKTDKFGTIQKVIKAEKAADLPGAKKEAQEMLSPTVKEVFRGSGLGINTLRAGDKIEFESLPYPVYVLSVTHRLQEQDEMTITAATLDYIRRELYRQ